MSCPAEGTSCCLPRPISYSRDCFGQETSEQQREVVKRERSGNICVDKAAELWSRSWAHGLALSVWLFIRLLAALLPSLEGSQLNAGVPLLKCHLWGWKPHVGSQLNAGMPWLKCHLRGWKPCVFSWHAWEADNHGEEEHGAAREQGKNRVLESERAQPPPDLDVARGSILAQP